MATYTQSTLGRSCATKKAKYSSPQAPQLATFLQLPWWKAIKSNLEKKDCICAPSPATSPCAPLTSRPGLLPRNSDHPFPMPPKLRFLWKVFYNKERGQLTGAQTHSVQSDTSPRHEGLKSSMAYKSSPRQVGKSWKLRLTQPCKPG